jgi:hypothetical protein
MNSKILIAFVLTLAALPSARATETENLNMQVLPAQGTETPHVTVSAEGQDSIPKMELKKPFPKTTYLFRTDDAQLQATFDEALQKARGNIVLGKDNTRYMVEGAQYRHLWTETQPMGGNMFARHDLEIAVNNQMIFIETQREDGRLVESVNDVTTSQYCRFTSFQGFCFPIEAFEVYYWLEKDKEFLRLLYQCFEKYDAYLWRFRDSNNDGYLETWCAGDTGEDFTTRFAGGWSMHYWPYDVPPTTNNMVDERIVGKKEAEKKADYFRNNGKNSFPQESMDIMSYSYAARDALALISRELARRGARRCLSARPWLVKQGRPRHTAMSEAVMRFMGISLGD